MGTLRTSTYLPADTSSVSPVSNAVRFDASRIQMLTLFVSRVSARPVVVLRVVLGLVCVFRALEEWRVMVKVFRPGIVRFPVFDWLPVLNGRQAVLLVAIWLVAAAAFTIGWCVRLAGGILAGVMFATLFIDQQLYFSHLYLISLEVLLLAIANPTMKSHTVPYWPILLLKIQLSIVYFFAAVSKLTPVYLSGWMIGTNLREGIVAGPNTLKAFAVASIMVEVFVALALWTPRLRKPAVVVGVLLHIGMVTMLTSTVAVQLALFAVACLAIYPLYFIQEIPYALRLENEIHA